jgi:hypothetical protein
MRPCISNSGCRAHGTPHGGWDIDSPICPLGSQTQHYHLKAKRKTKGLSEPSKLEEASSMAGTQVSEEGPCLVLVPGVQRQRLMELNSDLKARVLSSQNSLYRGISG